MEIRDLLTARGLAIEVNGRATKLTLALVLIVLRLSLDTAYRSDLDIT